MNWIFKYSPIFFDFDGLLVNTEHLHFKAYKTLLEKHDVLFPWDFPAFAAVAHKSSEGLRKMISAHAPLLLQSFSWDNLYEQKKTLYLQLLEQGGLELMPGADQILQLTQNAQIPHAVVTNSTYAKISLIRKQLPVLQRIPYWITREDYQNPKPAPDAYLKALEVLGRSEKMLGFEDSLRGIRSLEGAAITPVLICSPDHPQMDEVSQESLRYYPSFVDIV